MGIDQAEWKLRKVLDAIHRHVPDRHELLTLLMHIVAVEFSARGEAIGAQAASAEFVAWCKKVAEMCDGKFDVDSSKD